MSAGAGSGAIDFSHPGASLSAAFAARGFAGQGGAATGFGAAGAVTTVVVAGGAASTTVVGGAGAAGWAALR